MPRLKTIKLNYNIYEKLMEVPNAADVNEAIRQLFYTLKNDAERAGAEQIIEENKKRIKENEEKIEELPAEREKFMSDLEEKYLHQKAVTANKMKVVELQIKNLSISQPRFGWETAKGWIDSQMENLKLGLKSLEFEAEELERKKSLIMEDEKQAENYEILRTRLIQQNQRMEGEIERFKGIIALCNKLDIDYDGKKETAAYVG